MRPSEFKRDINSMDELKQYLQWLKQQGINIEMMKEEYDMVVGIESDLEAFEKQLQTIDSSSSSEQISNTFDNAAQVFMDDLERAAEGALKLHDRYTTYRGSSDDKKRKIAYIYRSINEFLLGQVLPQVLLDIDKEERKTEQYFNQSILHMSNQSSSGARFPEVLDICATYAPDSKMSELMELKKDLQKRS